MLSCEGQSDMKKDRHVGGPCEDCEALLDYKALNITPNAIDTLPKFEENEPKIKINGTVYHNDGRTPAEGIILYIYHTDRKGIYQASEEAKSWENKHGQYRAWLRSDKDGNFAFYTFRPAAYPNGNEAEHIHIYVNEPNTIPYYIDSYYFEDDPRFTLEKRSSLQNRGGSGIVKLELKNGIWTANRDIILGLNIPGYD